MGAQSFREGRRGPRCARGRPWGARGAPEGVRRGARGRWGSSADSRQLSAQHIRDTCGIAHLESDYDHMKATVHRHCGRHEASERGDVLLGGLALYDVCFFQTHL